jgi:hypothetical protein
MVQTRLDRGVAVGGVENARLGTSFSFRIHFGIDRANRDAVDTLDKRVVEDARLGGRRAIRVS